MVINRYQFATLIGLNVHRKHIYGGTVPASVVAKRRTANKAARKARRNNRGAK